MRVRAWGTRGSLAVSGPDVMKYGGNTSCVEVRDRAGGLTVLDAGTGLRRLGERVEPDIGRVDMLLTHFHVDHLFGFGFFSVLFRPNVEVHVWGPASRTMGLRARLNRYLSPPLFPVRLPDLPAHVVLHDVPLGEPFELPNLEVIADLVCHPGRTVGYRLDDGSATVAYLPDHEPRLGWDSFPTDPLWTSGWALARGVDVLIHDAQYTPHEYASRIGWGHSTIDDAITFATMAEVRTLVGFHHDPSHDDFDLDRIFAEAATGLPDGLELVAAREAAILDTSDVPTPS